MKLIDLLKGIRVIDIDGPTDIDISKVVDDSRNALKNSLFVAIDGFSVDGHKYISEAIDNGASAIVISKELYEIGNISNEDRVTMISVENTRRALARIASRFYNKPSEKMELIGVTGTNGKTSITYYVEAIFKEYGKKVGIIGSIGNLIDGELKRTKNTTPEPLEIQEIFNSMADAEINLCVMEASSHALDLGRVDYCQFDVGVFTNLTTDHLDYHKNFDNYYNAKIKLFYKTQKCNIINIDDRYGRRIFNEVKNLKTQLLTYGLDSSADIFASNIVYSAQGVRYTLNTPKGKITIVTNTPGEFTVYNTLAAAACGYIYEIDLQTIKQGIESIKGIKGRFEVIPVDRDFTVIIDFAHTPEGLENALKTIKQFATGRIIVLFGGGGDRDRSKRPKMGEIAAKNSDVCIVTSDNPRSEDPKRIIDEILVGVHKVRNDFISIIDRKEAIRYALDNSMANDVILLAGKGHETYTLIEDTILPFDERKIVYDILNEEH
ncbi:UDP-N-acetylmuramoyl-L-alanyl-D-glutamate--2,6-diaminopimelate ligase [Sporosalibacterium faouarense]|uniref:UDP-N-acetylmuramoyl-L-alanyl-D-glutamate--2, 6-diaminopimelate ligase n=1 Tax=Sporosalibacterium faouarense TaxID=516123 RepID=UPI00141CFEB9|nr:UDP-N-acetylmuramoyl-L-alanyl-D-glutamate--2,6-diaminopimelate ligase [Sporosalibacterium faouarense]MTI49046.1 UDP-N-acetylmuramoyl-L-alanyl-D-glutamate--2,6-diaminopimelate ligase [Bacillota bacterium]